MNDRKIILGVIVMITLVTTIGATEILQQTAGKSIIAADRAAPVAIFENDVYVAWWTNKTGNDEVMYRVSSDGGKTFTDKINLSNTPGADSVDVEIAADEGKVAVSWWERSQTANEPVIRVSGDNGKTFGPLLKLETNGTLGG
jgi:hypothetical protein